jgi:RNA polymerase sigma factor (sigma-70 family)
MLRLRTDEQLVSLFRKGVDEAFDVIDARYRPRLLRYTRRMLGGCGADAEAALQDVFLSAYGALRRDDRPIALRAWLYRIAKNRCIDEMRRPAPAPADVLDLSRGPLRDPVVESERRERVRQLLMDIDHLPEQQRRAATLRWLEGRSYAEIAATLGVGTKAVKSLLVRARIGLADADEARNAPCAEIHRELAAAFERGVRMTGRSRRHLRDCAACRDYRRRLRGIDRALGLAAPGHGALATLAKLVGIGGAGSGAAVGAGTVAVGGPIAAKVTALVCCGVVTAGVAELKAHPTRVAPAPAHASGSAPPATPATPAAVGHRVDRAVPPAAAPAPRHTAPSHVEPRTHASALAPLRDSMLVPHRVAVPAAKPITPRQAARTTGGTLAPEEPAATADTDAPLQESVTGLAATPDASTIAPPEEEPATPDATMPATDPATPAPAPDLAVPAGATPAPEQAAAPSGP